MKEIKLLALNIRNFKGCNHLILDLSGRSATIYGDNAAGKTTIFDALTWLLFNKDSRGRSSFEIKPLDSTGQVKDHAAVTEVEATFHSNGTNTTLRKTFFERWSTKRGSVDASYDGNTSEYYVDDVPCRKYEYERRVGELVSEDLFQMLTNVTWFCEGMDWKARRKVLLDVCDVPDDTVIMGSAPEFTPLSVAMGTLTLEDFKKKLVAQRKGLNTARSTIPARLDEQKKTIETLQTIDFLAVESERNAKNAQMAKLSDDLAKLSHGVLATSKRNEAVSLRNELQRLVNENNSHRTSQLVPVVDERSTMQMTLLAARDRMTRCQSLLRAETQLISRCDQAISGYRDRWNQIDSDTYHETTCPTCGQSLPQDAQNTARAKFEAEKERLKAEAVEGANREKAVRSAALDRHKLYSNDAEDAEREVNRIEAALAQYVPGTQPPICDLPGFQAQAQDLKTRIQTLEAEAQAAEVSTESARNEITIKIDGVRAEIASLDAELAKKTLLQFARQREDELRKNAQETAAALEELDKQLFLCEEFTRYKVSFIEDSINRKFRLARFRLFQEQVNGGLVDCCEATYDGIPFSSLNNGMRINLGVDVIRTISEHYGLRVPLIVDNAESVVNLLSTDTQVIRLVVSGPDKELRCEYEN